jgi:lysophospholipid acyltransferase (LPLAT)-like uncharacterized protein
MPDSAGSARIQQIPLSQRALIRLGFMLVRILCATLRYKLIDEAGYLDEPVPRPVILLIWHNRILALPVLYRRCCPSRKGLRVLTSASRDGAYLSEFVRYFGLESVRGSSSRRGTAALFDLMRTLEDGFDLCVTPDGPRGPRYSLRPGVILLSERCQIPLIPVLVEYSAYWRFNSWDGFVVPKPFSAVTVTFRPRIQIGVTGSEAEFETERQRVEKAMTEHMVMK